MHLLRTSHALLLVAVSLAAAQAPSLEDALSAHTNASSFLELLHTTTPEFLKKLDAVNSDDPITLLAPSNAAFGRIPFVDVLGPAWAANDTAAITNILEYHVLPGIHTSEGLNGTFQFLPTWLRNESWTTVSGGQRIGAVLPGAVIPVHFGRSY